MNWLVKSAAITHPHGPQILECVVELGVKVLPLAHAEVRQEIGFAEFSALALSAQGFPLIVDSVPNVEQGEEIGFGVGEAFVR
jgi:hypothetical protein